MIIPNFSGFNRENRCLFFEIINYRFYLETHEIEFIIKPNYSVQFNMFTFIKDIEDIFNYIIKQVLINHDKKDWIIIRLINEKVQIFEYGPKLIEDYDINRFLMQMEAEEFTYSTNKPIIIEVELFRGKKSI